jgi:threonine synthase
LVELDRGDSAVRVEDEDGDRGFASESVNRRAEGSVVYVVAVEDADFDACQSIVKTLFSDKEFNATHRLGAINSINWARILAQVVACEDVAKVSGGHDKLDLVALIRRQLEVGREVVDNLSAKRLGLPMRELVVATNENDILERFFRTGRYAREDLPLEGQAAETAAVNGSSDGQLDESIMSMAGEWVALTPSTAC